MAAGGDSGNVRLGPGRLWVAPLGTTEPTSASAALPSAWRPVGYTEEGSAFSTDQTQEDIEVAEEIDPILSYISKRTNTLVFAMAELTRRNLAMGLGDMTGAFAANNGAAFEPPDLEDISACMFVWDSAEDAAGNDQNSRWLFRQAKPSGTIELPRRKAPTKATIASVFTMEKPAGLAAYKIFPNADGLI